MAGHREKVRVTTLAGRSRETGVVVQTNCGTSAEGYLVLVTGFGAAGAGVGALAGLAIKKDRWERVPVHRVRVGIRPVPAGAGLQVSFGWRGR